jgi:hypothetical protein
MGSNGLTSARHDVFNKTLATKYPESFDSSVPEDLVYSGKYNLTDVEPETVGRRVYAAPLQRLMHVQNMFSLFLNTTC